MTRDYTKNGTRKTRMVGVRLFDGDAELFFNLEKELGKINPTKLFVDALKKLSETKDKTYFYN